MKIVVMGAGAGGCYHGGMLARAGHAVTLIGRAAHVEAVRRDGLLMETRTFTERVPMAASTDASSLRDADLVLVCVKSTDTALAAEEMAPLLAPGARVLSLQNGVDNAPCLQALLGRPVMPAVVYVATEMAGPGHLRHHGRGDLVIGPGADGEALAALFAGAGVPTQISDNVDGALWAKLILNCAYNALSATTRLPYGRLVQQQGVDAVMRDVVDECSAVALADGVTLPPDMHGAVQRLAGTMPAQFSSTAQDLARGKPSEIDHLNGHVMRRGETLGVATPVNRVLWALVKLQESRAATPPAGTDS